MALQFRRGVINDLPDPSDAAIGEPLFTTDEGKLRIKKADGTYAVIGSGTSTGELDLSGIAAGSLVKVNTGQDGFVAAAGTDLPLHTQAISTINGLQDALDEKVELADLPQNPDGTLDLAQESTLLGFAATLSALQTSTAQTQADLDLAEATLASTAAITLHRAEAGNGYLYFTTSGIGGVPGTWSLQSPTFAAPEFIDGGGADADNPT